MVERDASNVSAWVQFPVPALQKLWFWKAWQYHYGMKTCHACKISKDVKEFNKNASKKDGLSSTCRECMKAYRKKHYDNNRETYVEDILARRLKNKQLTVDKLLQYFEGKFCIDCHNGDPRVLEFDHIDPALKDYSISRMIAEGRSWDSIQLEIKKCEIRCANCHRIRTQLQFGSYRALWI